MRCFWAAKLFLIEYGIPGIRFQYAVKSFTWVIYCGQQIFVLWYIIKDYRTSSTICFCMDWCIHSDEFVCRKTTVGQMQK